MGEMRNTYINMVSFDVWPFFSHFQLTFGPSQTDLNVSPQWKLHWRSQKLNEQTFSLQLSDSVCLKTCWIWQAVHRIPARKVLRMLREHSLTSWFFHKSGQLGQLRDTTHPRPQDLLSNIWRRAGSSPSQIINRQSQEEPLHFLTSNSFGRRFEAFSAFFKISIAWDGGTPKCVSWQMFAWKLMERYIALLQIKYAWQFFFNCYLNFLCTV